MGLGGEPVRIFEDLDSLPSKAVVSFLERLTVLGHPIAADLLDRLIRRDDGPGEGAGKLEGGRAAQNAGVQRVGVATGLSEISNGQANGRQKASTMLASCGQHGQGTSNLQRLNHLILNDLLS